MIDRRALGQEIQEQVLDAARKGQKRVTRTVRNVTATAQLIRPQLPNWPALSVSGLPTPAQLREKATELMARIPTPGQLRERAPEFMAKLPTAGQLRERAPELMAKLPSPEQVRASAEELAGQFRSVQREFVGRVRTATTPLARQASAVLTQAGVPGIKVIPTLTPDG